MGCLWRTLFVSLVITIDEELKAMMCIDRSHVVHDDIKLNSGLCITMGLGTMINVSNKLGLNTTSSKKIEIVSNSDRFPKYAWFRFLRLAKGDDAKEDMLNQDKKTSIILQKNIHSQHEKERNT